MGCGVRKGLLVPMHGQLLDLEAGLCLTHGGVISEVPSGASRAGSSRLNEAFVTYGPQDVRFLVERHPLAWVHAVAGADRAEASLLPLLGEYDGAGQLVALIGHMARGNPLHATLSADPRASVLFAGPQGYISPEHAGVLDWAPTWNYAQLRIVADVQFDEALTEPSLDMLIAAMEQGRAQPWDKRELGARYAGMARAIIGFRAEVRSCAGVFKMGQDERPEVLAHILKTHPDAELVEWMRRFT